MGESVLWDGHWRKTFHESQKSLTLELSEMHKEELMQLLIDVCLESAKLMISTKEEELLFGFGNLESFSLY